MNVNEQIAQIVEIVRHMDRKSIKELQKGIRKVAAESEEGRTLASVSNSKYNYAHHEEKLREYRKSVRDGTFPSKPKNTNTILPSGNAYASTLTPSERMKKYYQEHIARVKANQQRKNPYAGIKRLFAEPKSTRSE